MMMTITIPRNKNVLLVATTMTMIAMIVVASLTFITPTEARLQGHTNRRTTNSNSNAKKHRQRQLYPTEKEIEDDKIFVALDKEYRENEASKQKAHEKATASHNKMVPTEVLLQELETQEKESAKKEAYHQAQARNAEKEKEQVETTVNDDVDIDGLESILKMKKEYKAYQAVEGKRKKIADDDKKIISQMNEAQRVVEKQNKVTLRIARLQEHEENELALVKHEASILELQIMEQNAQDKAMKEQLTKKTILQKEYEKQMNLHIRTMELLKA